MPCDPAEAETNFRWYFEVTILYQISFCLFPYIVNVVVKPTQRQIGVEKVRGVRDPAGVSRRFDLVFICVTGASWTWRWRSRCARLNRKEILPHELVVAGSKGVSVPRPRLRSARSRGVGRGAGTAINSLLRFSLPTTPGLASPPPHLSLAAPSPTFRSGSPTRRSGESPLAVALCSCSPCAR